MRTERYCWSCGDRLFNKKLKFCSDECQVKWFTHSVYGSSCTGWSGSKLRGYPLISGRPCPKRASRWVYEKKHGRIPAGMEILHTCDNPECLNIRHLRIGTHADNMREMADKGRSSRGELRPGAKQSDSDVVRIRKEYDAVRRSGRSKQERIIIRLSQKYGISHGGMMKVVKRKTYKHL